ncbi:a-macroglobulin complement component : Uncharacterized protein OS=Cystobacter violaceus Cb vi76 GN=Q664_21445 PE=4 SV=1: A2M_N: A2M: Thiol-ester_cl: A2M_comp [Gemmata massiliana]|uniref:Alpha-2-macroglobulin domain-containing protein n=1 Tax=Gemmata massiliana TaxID=1210884 RepID=A0A6P2D5D3_9BACT|nr:alpha-2-macroglobulin family protein [Gemmata massiliana]VTR94630.1 a-macroglobulin complement component : Uncharacterized protein OS=Cystobacter violaceus Cb vi76 GN=Q664_21445 PE=4 SV=1: A2M_N: A2M: Thiol-ester_cl: A2M_comp [Gemmata massiliana]
MNPESNVIAELQPLLDALCEEVISPDQLRRLEELVLMHPEAEEHYIRFMSFFADLIGHVAGLPEPKALAQAPPESVAVPATRPAPVPRAPAEVPPAHVSPNPSPKQQENVMRRPRSLKSVVWLAVFGTLGALVGSQGYGWYSRSHDVAEKQRALQIQLEEVARAEAEKAKAQSESRKHIEAALAAENALQAEYQAAYESARKAIEDKEFVVRLTGPAHIQPGAPNKWQIETLRHGAVGRPQKMDVVVKDGKDQELLRQTHDKPVGAATLELPVAFWEKVKPGSDLFLEVTAFTDDRKSVLAERLPLARPVFVTHLVTDKPLYKPGETIRFRSLTLDRSTLRPPGTDLHLKFRLRDPGDAVTTLDEGNGRLLQEIRPVLGPDNKPLRGIGVGEHTLASDAPGGEYKLDLFEASAETGKEVLLETRKFIVNRYVPDTFEKKLEFDGKSYGPNEFVQARIDVSRTAGGPMKNATANVVASTGSSDFFQQSNSLFTTDSTGKVFLDVRFKLPAEVFEKVAPGAAPAATLSVNIRDGSDSETIVRPIPLVTKTLRVEFFPEGGDMVEGVPGRVYFMVRTPNGKPADLKGIITDGTTTFAEVSTLTDAENPGVNRGHGVFTLKPRARTQYFLKLTSPSGITEPTKDGFPLPEAKADGVALTALDAVTEKGGVVRVRLQTAHGPKTLHVGAYVRERLIAQQKVTLDAHQSTDVSLKGDDTAGGVTRITVFEEQRDDAGQTALLPRSERLVFRGQGQHLVLTANPDRVRYTPSGKVRLDLSATTETGAPTPAVLMVGVVNRSVITMADNKNDRLLPTHFLLSGEVKNSAELEHADFLLTDHPKAAVALDLLLGTQGWRRFAEQDVPPAKPVDQADVNTMLVAHGQRPTAPLQLLELEKQRVSAEFTPRLEMARIQVATTEAQWSAIPAALTEKLAQAQAHVSAAQALKTEAQSALSDYKERYQRFGAALVPLLAAALVAIFIFIVVSSVMSATATKPAGRLRPFIAGITTLAICGMLVLLVNNMGSDARSTFSFVGSSIKPSSLEEARGSIKSKNTPSPGLLRGFDDSGARPTFDPTAQPSPAQPLLPPGAPAGPKAAPPGPPTVGTPASGGKLPGGGKPSPKPDTGRGTSFPNRDGTFTGDVQKRLSSAQSDKARAALQFRSRRVPDGFADRMPEGLIHKNDGRRPTLPVIMPFMVREYAHERDPQLGEVRSDFTETVYWHPVLVLPENGKSTIEFQLSDDIARYQVLVAGHSLDGRIGAITTTLEARKPFSVDPKLPLEISHTDTVDAPIRVTNDSDVARSVTFNTTTTGFKTKGPLQESIELAANAKGRKLLRLNADQLQGDASLLIEGRSAGGDPDVIKRMIRVVPDGFPRVGSVSDMLEKGRARGSITLPKDVVPGSLRVRLEMYPTTMADLVKGLDGLLREPYGCFEQTSTTNYPNALILDYMNQTNQTNPAAAVKAKGLLDKGYGRLTSFECLDTPEKAKHGFEWFGAADRQHEALTAYGLLQFKDMARVHPVDPVLIQRTQAYLLSRRDGKGGFKRGPDGHSFGSAPKHTVDAYIVWALVESDPDDQEKLDLKTEIATLKAEALNENSVGGKDAYFVALVANVMLQRGDRETAHKLLDRLKEKHVKNGAVTGATTSITRSGGRDLEIEVTALALLGWLRANDPAYGTAIKDATKWIAQQRGGYGGFGSTQSTIMALKALALFAKKNAHPSESGDLGMLVGGEAVCSRQFTEKDIEVIALDVPNPEAIFKFGAKTELEITTTAKHSYPIALSYTYTTLTPLSAEKCAVQISTKLAKTEATEGDTVPVAVILENRQKRGQGMTMAIVGLPAGMRVPTDMKQLTDLREKGQISYFETRDRELILYWRELAPEQKIALSVDLVCDVPGTYRGPASRGYLYYDADHKHWVEPLSVKIAPMPETK